MSMEKRAGSDVDDDFSEIYKEYTGPPGSTASRSQDNRVKDNKRSHAGSAEEDEQLDPYAVPTGFISREAKVWEAKSKATERNWKKRKEEEMICKICGESGHFTQGCPSTLGGNRKSQDFFERVPARERHVRELFTEKVIQRIEKDIGCKIKMDEKFIIVSGKDRLILKKGVDAVHRVKDEADQSGSSNSHMARTRSSEQSPDGAHLRRHESQRAHPGSRNSSHFQRFGRQDKAVEDHVRKDLQRIPKGSPQAFREAYVSAGTRSRSSLSKSPGRLPYPGNSYNSYDGWDTERRGSDLQSGNQFEYPAYPQILYDLELEYKREAIELGRIRDKEEDEENYKHREIIKEMRENYIKKLSLLRGTHKKHWEEFLQMDAQRRQQQTRQQISASGFGAYKQQAISEYDGPSVNAHYAGANLHMDSRGRYPNHVENYHSRPRDAYDEFQHQRGEDFGKSYNQY